VAGEKHSRERKPELDPGEHKKLPEMQATGAEELRLHAHDLPSALQA
jgi:hypothetical protein